MYQLLNLDKKTAVDYQLLTYPIYRPILRNLASDSSLIAIGVQLHSQPVGLVLAQLYPGENCGELLSLFVIPEYRQQGLGKVLLTQMEEELNHRRCSQVGLVYLPNATTPALERILEQRHWFSPQPRMLVCRSTTTHLQEIPWLNLHHLLPPTYEIFPWTKLTRRERKTIQKQQTGSLSYPDILSPFNEEHLMEPVNSLGLRCQGEVVGWMITHRVAVDTIRYTSLFVKKELQSIGRALPLLATAIKLQLENPEATKAICTVTVDNAPMVKFAQRRLFPYLSDLRQSMGTFKSLKKH